MPSGQSIASLGAYRQDMRMNQIIAHNLSNAQTTGFKKDVLVFENVLSRAEDRWEGSDRPVTLFRPGPMQQTGRELDVAVDGEGFFKIQTPSGVRYTRAGNFRLNKEQLLVNASGYPVLGRRGEISLAGRRIDVDSKGAVRLDGREVDRLALVTFPDQSVLKKEGHTLFRSDSPEAETPIESPVLSGMLENSNVNPVEEMLHLLDAHRAFESCLKVIQTTDSLDGKATNELGKV